MTDTAIFWFRQDLRLSDNIALYKAALHENVYAVYVYDESLGDKWKIGAASRWWLHHSLKALKARIPLNILQGASFKQILDAVKHTNAKCVYINIVLEPAYRKLDTQLKEALAEYGIKLKRYNSNLLFNPKEILTSSGTPYNIYTPFWKHCLAKFNNRDLFPSVNTQKFKIFSKLQIGALKLLPTKSNWADKLHTYCQPGEISAFNKLEYFIKDSIKAYKVNRNIPSLHCTSKLSPHLHFGEISPLQIWYAINKSNITDENKFAYLREIGWREFSYYLLFHNPQITDKNFKNLFDNYHWDTNSNFLKAWQEGKTGYPIVDAGMKELWATGYMHNRVRMVVASFLIKDLLIDWRKGHEWFWDTLVDADLAINSVNWQWVAGSGPDAAQYYRIFNPVLQGEKFDPQGDYVRKWLPELEKLPNKYIHKPWQTPKELLKSLGITIPGTYPKRLVNHEFARKIALEHYKKLKQQ